MSLPVRATLEDISQTLGYVATKPTGATTAEISSVVGEKLANQQRISALQFWGLLELQDGGKFKLTEDGRRCVRSDADRIDVLQGVLKRTPAYLAIVERAAHRKEESLLATDVGAHWHSYFKDDVSDSEDYLKQQVTAFFQLAEGAGLGTMILGRKGQQTRFGFTVESLGFFVSSLSTATSFPTVKDQPATSGEIPPTPQPATSPQPPTSNESVREPLQTLRKSGQGIFIAHGKNKKPLEQLKKVLDQFKITYKVATDEPNLGRPIGAKIREIMEACNCAILIFTADEEFKNSKGETIWRPSENVIYELGASGYLYDNKLVIMKEKDVTFPSNFQDIGYISFDKDQLESKAMELLAELIGFGILKVST